MAHAGDVVRVMGRWVRTADALLARGAASNAAASLAADRVRWLEEARALRDLHSLRELREPVRAPALQPVIDLTVLEPARFEHITLGR